MSELVNKYTVLHVDVRGVSDKDIDKGLQQAVGFGVESIKAEQSATDRIIVTYVNETILHINDKIISTIDALEK